jgi:hypothetical protein
VSIFSPLSVQTETLPSCQEHAAKGRIFLLSPADLSGVRASLLLRKQASFELAARLRESAAPLGEVFSFISGLYFRGKLAYARAFAEPTAILAPPILVITTSRGFLTPETPLGLEDLKNMARVQVSASDARYRKPLERDAMHLAERIGTKCEVVLLGSIATPKYVEPLLAILGDRLMFPSEFVGRGDMSRGGLMLRAVRECSQLAYTPIIGSLRHGARPPRLAGIPCVATQRGKRA